MTSRARSIRVDCGAFEVEALATSGQSPGFVGLHAVGAGKAALLSLAEELGPLLGSAVLPELPTSTEAGAAPLGRQIDAARAAVRLAGPDGVLFGHSFGGLVALLATLDGVAARALVLYEPIVLGCLDESDPEDASARAWDRSLLDDMERRTASGDPEPGVARFVEAYNEVEWAALPVEARRSLVDGAPGMVALTQAVHHQPLDLERIAGLELPIVLLYGDESPPGVQRMTKALHRLLPRTQILALEGCGHMAPRLRPGLVAEAVRRLL